MNLNFDPLPVTKTPETSTDLCVRMSGGWTEAQLEAAWALVKPAGHWKNAIDATLEFDRHLPFGLEAVIRAAVSFYAGCLPTFLFKITADKALIRVRAAGYYAAVGA